MSSEDSMIRGLAIEQRRRLLASIMSHAEREFYASLTPAQQQAFREKVVLSVNTYHDFILDLIKVNREDVVRNEEALNLLKQVQSSARRIESAVVTREPAAHA